MNQIPDIYYDGSHKFNPCIFSPNAPYAIFFEQTKDVLFSDTDLYKRFIENCIKNFRNMKVYTHYKGYLYDLGLDRCQILGNITNKMASIEMHHNGITIFDIAVCICNHLLNTIDRVTTFDVISHLRRVHTMNMVPLVMLCKTMHQLEHNDDEFYVPVQMTFGDWSRFLEEYKYGITYGISKKIKFWIEKSLQEQIDNCVLNAKCISLNEQIRSWAEYNECAFNNNSDNNTFYRANYNNNYLFPKQAFR